MGMHYEGAPVLNEPERQREIPLNFMNPLHIVMPAMVTCQPDTDSTAAATFSIFEDRILTKGVGLSPLVPEIQVRRFPLSSLKFPLDTSLLMNFRMKGRV